MYTRPSVFGSDIIVGLSRTIEYHYLNYRQLAYAPHTYHVMCTYIKVVAIYTWAKELCKLVFFYTEFHTLV